MALGAGTAAVLAASDPIPRIGGYAGVAAMLAASPFYVAHAGCSRAWPEMIGMAARELTWAQVQALRILGSNAQDDPTQPSRPYMRWEEIIAAYYPSHVILVDPKSAIDHGAELMAMMNALPGTPRDHLVCKYFGVSGDAGNTLGWARLAADSGYRRWGYFYAADSADFAAYQGRWDILGLDYTADAAHWARMREYGKPVIGHVVPNRVAVITARSKGATGVVASDPTAMLTVSD